MQGHTDCCYQWPALALQGCDYQACIATAIRLVSCEPDLPTAHGELPNSTAAAVSHPPVVLFSVDAAVLDHVLKRIVHQTTTAAHVLLSVAVNKPESREGDQQHVLRAGQCADGPCVSSLCTTSVSHCKSLQLSNPETPWHHTKRTLKQHTKPSDSSHQQHPFCLPCSRTLTPARSGTPAGLS